MMVRFFLHIFCLIWATSVLAETIKSPFVGCKDFDLALSATALSVGSEDPDDLVSVNRALANGRCRRLLPGTQVTIERALPPTLLRCVRPVGEPADCFWIPAGSLR